jgi:Holliday junction resolvase
MPTRARRVDANQKELVKVLKQLGWLVLDLSPLGKGVPDLLVCRRDVVKVVEVKTPKGKPTKAQQRVIDAGWPVCTVRVVDDLLKL